MCDDGKRKGVELYMDADFCVEIRQYEHPCLTVIDECGDMSIVRLTPDRARQIGLGLIKWSDAQRDGAEHD